MSLPDKDIKEKHPVLWWLVTCLVIISMIIGFVPGLYDYLNKWLVGQRKSEATFESWRKYQELMERYDRLEDFEDRLRVQESNKNFYFDLRACLNPNADFLLKKHMMKHLDLTKKVIFLNDSILNNEITSQAYLTRRSGLIFSEITYLLEEEYFISQHLDSAYDLRFVMLPHKGCGLQ